MVTFFFVKHKTAYAMRISDCSADVCSSDLRIAIAGQSGFPGSIHDLLSSGSRSSQTVFSGRSLFAIAVDCLVRAHDHGFTRAALPFEQILRVGHHGRDRKSAAEGKRVSVRVDLGGSRMI